MIHSIQTIDRGGTEADQHGMSRSSHWPHFRDEIVKARGKCELTGVTTDLEAHHIIPFHYGVFLGRGYIELDERNIIVLSRGPLDVHLLLGHLDDFTSANFDVRTNGPAFANMSEDEIKASPEWQRLHLHRPRAVHLWTFAEKLAVTHLIDTKLPIGHMKAAA